MFDQRTAAHWIFPVNCSLENLGTHICKEDGDQQFLKTMPRSGSVIQMIFTSCLMLGLSKNHHVNLNEQRHWVAVMWLTNYIYIRSSLTGWSGSVCSAQMSIMQSQLTFDQHFRLFIQAHFILLNDQALHLFWHLRDCVPVWRNKKDTVTASLSPPAFSRLLGRTTGPLIGPETYTWLVTSHVTPCQWNYHPLC